MIAAWITVKVSHAVQDYLVANFEPEKIEELVYLLCMMMVFVGICGAAHYNGRSQLRLNVKHKYYEFRARRGQLYRGPMHNIFIQLVQHKAEVNQYYYSLVLRGTHIPNYVLASNSKKLMVMRSLGRKICRNLGNMNYFDHETASLFHVIHHRRSAFRRKTLLEGRTAVH